MKSFITIALALAFGTGCYTQVRSSGDYWGYTGRHQKEKVVVPPLQSDSMYSQQALPDSTEYVYEDTRSRDDAGYSSGETTTNNYYYDPVQTWGYYSAPAVSFSIGWGAPYYDGFYRPHHRPWWSIGYYTGDPYWYPHYYDPYWDWYYQPSYYSYYGCEPTPFFPYYNQNFGFHREGYNSDHDHFGLNGNSRTGRIGGGERRSSGSSAAGYDSRNSGSNSPTGNRGVRSSSTNSGRIGNGVPVQTGTAGYSGRSQPREAETGTQRSWQENTSSTKPVQTKTSGEAARSNEAPRETPVRSNQKSEPEQKRSNDAPVKDSQKNSTPAEPRGPGHSQNQMYMPRDNPRYNPQSANNKTGRYAQNVTSQQSHQQQYYAQQQHLSYSSASRYGGNSRSPGNRGSISSSAGASNSRASSGGARSSPGAHSSANSGHRGR